mmetsp:Transcript_34948/g.35152  ORF Transcript_34948/g.35152 Transcript_34948/m.35152 type:complete len:83 (-) Transcript_34948:588-836(-)
MHGKLLSELQNAAYVERNEYPTTLAGTYDLMIRRSGVFNTRLTSNNGHGGRGGHFDRSGNQGRGGRGGYTFTQGRARDNAEH